MNPAGNGTMSHAEWGDALRQTKKHSGMLFPVSSVVSPGSYLSISILSRRMALLCVLQPESNPSLRDSGRNFKEANTSSSR